MTRTEAKLHVFAESVIPGAGDLLVKVNKVARGRQDGLGMAIAIRFFLTMDTRQDAFELLVSKVEKQKADRYAEATQALRDLAVLAGLNHEVQP